MQTVESLARPIDMQHRDDLPWMLTGDEIAEKLHLSRSKAYGLMASGELPTVRFGRSVRVPRAALIAWIEAHCEHAD